MEVDINEYVNHSEIKEAILDGLKHYAHNNAERIISNAGHHLATDIVNKNLGVNAEADIAIKAREVISELSQYTLFDGGGYGRGPSDARKFLDQCVRENKDDLLKAVKHVIHNLSKRDVMEIIKDGKVKLVVE